MNNSQLTAHSLPLTIIIEETAGINRINEPVTVGLPFPKDMLSNNVSHLSLNDPECGYIPLQTQPCSKWLDGSIKWLLLDFQASVKANTTKKLKLMTLPSPLMGEGQGRGESEISINNDQNCFNIDTNTASFFINTSVFKPFDLVVIAKNDILDSSESKIILTDESGTEYEPQISNIFIETKGKLRTTFKVEGEFKSFNKPAFANFFSRVSFFANSSIVKIEFTIHNPQAAKHLGGLWDLGDPGSIFFKDLSIYTTLKTRELSAISYELNNELSAINYQLNDDKPSAMSYELNSVRNLIVYQDSSGGKNWKSLNHINRNGEVRNSFKGYRIFSDGKIIKEGLRANPIISIKDKDKQISGTMRYFWQNFPKSLEAKDNTLIVRLFPQHYNDIFELQGGEQKTHSIFLNFSSQANNKTGLEWVQEPLIPRASPEWYTKSNVFYYLIPENKDTINEFTGLVNTAIKGDNTFFDRREIIDEYGWRNFGEFYADHEAVRDNMTYPLISHYNNQYDCIYGALMQYLRNGDLRWFILADQLSTHVKDIDIYHTNYDRPEYNHGLFWHTEHYIDAYTCTHRCFSQKHLEFRDQSNYGGGPSLSHNYTTGLLFHHYITGDYSSLEAVKDLASFAKNNMDSENTLSNNALNGLKKLKFYLKNIRNETVLVQNTKVYSLEGPGRASGNCLNTLLDAFILTSDKDYLVKADTLIHQCVHPGDDIATRDLLDIENRWFYVVFLQSLGKYLDVKTEQEQYDYMWSYAKQSLLNYASWIVENEVPYLERPEKLEYPNETWAAQEVRKCNVLLYAAKYSETSGRELFLKKAKFFYNKGLRYLLNYDTKTLTRPVVLMMLNGMMYCYFKNNKIENKKNSEFSTGFQKSKYYKLFCANVFVSVIKTLMKFSLRREVQYIKWRFISK